MVAASPRSRCEPLDGSRLNFGVLCHRNCADRIREALLPSTNDAGDGDDDAWTTLGAAEAGARDADAHATPSSPHDDPSFDSSSSGGGGGGRKSRSCTVVPTPEEKGPRKSRIGYTLFVIEGAATSPSDLSPVARRHISWAGMLTHRSSSAVAAAAACPIDGSGDDDDDEGRLRSMLLTDVVREIRMELMAKSFDAERDFLRLDVHPKCYNSEVCDALNDGVHHHRDPIKLACSASKVSHVVSVVVVQSTTLPPSSSAIQSVFWGISERRDHFEGLNKRLNDHAAGEVVMEPTDPRTGLDCSADDDVPWDAPVSRAYYKLAQVFDDDRLVRTMATLRNDRDNDRIAMGEIIPKKESILSHGTGLDIGASPGGWTQVLRNDLGMPTVVAVDPGLLARRVTSPGGVIHVRDELSSETSVESLARHAPYSAVVCDASVSNANELLTKIADTLEGVSSLLQSRSRDNDGDDARAGDDDVDGIFAWPMCLVVTLKLPYKTEGSIERNLEKTHRLLPDCLGRIASLGSLSSKGNDGDGGDVVEVRYRICHLLANSISERTLVAIFHKK